MSIAKQSGVIHFLKQGPQGETGEKGEKGDKGDSGASYHFAFSPNSVNTRGGYITEDVTVKVAIKKTIDGTTTQADDSYIQLVALNYDGNIVASATGYGSCSVRLTSSMKVNSVTAYASAAQAALTIKELAIMYYAAGAYDEQTTYTNDGLSTPIVEYHSSGDAKQYWFLSYKGEVTGQAPAADSSYWTVITRWNYLYTQLLMADFAMLGSGVFWGDYFFSQQGEMWRWDVSTGDAELYSTNDYSYFADDNEYAFLSQDELYELYDVEGREDDNYNYGRWAPLWCVNLKTGQMRVGAEGVFSGSIRGAYFYKTIKYASNIITADTTIQIPQKTDIVVVCGMRPSTSADDYTLTLKLPDHDTCLGKHITIYNYGWNYGSSAKHSFVDVIDDGATDDIYMPIVGAAAVVDAISMLEFKRIELVCAKIAEATGQESKTGNEWVCIDRQEF